MATRITSGGNNRRQIVEEADSFNHANVDEIYWSSGSVNSPLVVNAPEIKSSDEDFIDAPGRRSSFGMSVFNLMNAILGSGILGLSYAMAKSGIVLFTCLLVTVALLADFSIHLLLKMCVVKGVKSYEEVGLFAFGIPGKLLAACAILLQNIGAMSSYLFIVKDELPSIIGAFLGAEDKSSGEWYLNGTYLLLMIVVIVIVPLSCLPKIGFLGYTSGLSILCMIFFTVVIVIKKFSIPCPLPSSIMWSNTTASNQTIEHDDVTGPHIGQYHQLDNGSTNQNVSSECQPQYFSFTAETAYALPTMAFSFVCHTAVLPVYCELAKPSKIRMQNVANSSIFICFMLYIVSALFGYLTFYGNVSSELLDGYTMTGSVDLVILIVRMAVCLAIVFTIPLIHYPARKALLMIVSTWLPLRDTTFPWVRHFVSTAILITSVTCVAIFVPNLKAIFGVVGATASTSLVFILPSLFYLRLGTEPFKSVLKCACVGLLLIGITTLVISLATIIYTLIQT
ncbi:probable sodium-coupled neutral amino acid transporter 6 isoform X1 [Asterias rubens]|uniref:probable sodium-coupled neutral amino acid transporter 6 isoform X1 n=1 Tax=Asterias rubens TaxID=7604 RepID=UPI001455291F|nr:probable sodium-coupled neutral amino acid transporter 6 isoform X1 [Asterias rubens]